MIVGLTGKSFSGKSTIFNSLLEIKPDSAESRGKRLGTISVPDERIDFLSSVFKPKKTTFAVIQIEEMENSLETSKELSNLIGNLRNQEAICLVVDAFSDPEKSPLDDLRDMIDELKLADLLLVEKRLDRLQREGKASSSESGSLQKIKSQLEKDDGLIINMGLSDEERGNFTGFRFVTDKPILAVINQSEASFQNAEYPDLNEYAQNNSIKLLEMCAPLEWEISQLEDEDKKAFLEDLNISKPATGRFIRTCYDMMSYMSFFTVGPDEVRAWTITEGTPAVKAAGKIHSDIERGFIRAEVISYADFVECGSESAAKTAGKAPLEGKTYKVNDGDIIHFKFNV